MPLMDYALIFSDEQDLSGAGSVASTNVIDFEKTNPNLGDGTPLVVRVFVNTAFTTLTSLKVTIQHGATSTPATDLVSGPAVAQASLVAGYEFPRLMIPQTHLRYMRLYYTIAGTNPGAGSLTAFIEAQQ